MATTVQVMLSGGPFGGQVSTWDLPDGQTQLQDGAIDVVTDENGVKYRYRYMVDSTREDGGCGVFIGVE